MFNQTKHTTAQKMYWHRIALDSVWLPITFLSIYAISSYFNFSDHYYLWARQYEQSIDIDELLPALLASLLTLLWFAKRRINESDSGYSAYIKSKKTVLFSNNEIQQIITAIQTGRLPATWATRKQHLTSLNERHYVSPDNTSKTLCPKCKSEMIKRIGKTGSFAGKSFWGCSKFPACRGIVNI
jgi:hypothetical protein